MQLNFACVLQFCIEMGIVVLEGYFLSTYLPKPSVFPIIKIKRAKPKKVFLYFHKTRPELGVSRFSLYMSYGFVLHAHISQ
jgi:hypothetical protein